MHRNDYANRLREHVRRGRGSQELLDRLLVSALIEARSCERFEVLGRVTTEPDLAKLYQGLYRSENKHYTVFLRLAGYVRPAEEVACRWQELLAVEAEAIAAQPPGPRMHGGWQDA
jgi:tRNA-(ms[2]io[6]A)-hydroxylase